MNLAQYQKFKLWPLLFIFSILWTKIMILKLDLDDICFWIKTQKKNIAQCILAPIFIRMHWFCSVVFHHQNIFVLTSALTNGAQVNAVSRHHFVTQLPSFTSWILSFAPVWLIEVRWLRSVTMKLRSEVASLGMYLLPSALFGSYTWVIV